MSFFTDVATEMIYPLLPLFLGSVLGANARVIGAIEGAAESLAAFLKLASGWWSDRLATRKPLIVAGYMIATVARPFIAVAQTVSAVLAIRLIDRLGKGIRTAPRDALLADSSDPAARGRAFGFHAAMDNAGAVAGPIVAFLLLRQFHVPLRSVFWLAAVPGVAAMLVLVLLVKDAPRPPAASPSAPAPNLAGGSQLGRSFWLYLLTVFLFTLGNSSDAFLLMRSNQLGVPIELAPLLWAVLNLTKTVFGTWGGGLSDRFGRRPLIAAGWALYALVYLGFGSASKEWQAWGLMAAYGMFFALTQGTEKAMVGDLVPASLRGVAFGWFNLAIGLGALPASLLFGAVWDMAGSRSAFLLGSVLAATAAVCILVADPRNAMRVRPRES